MLSPLKKFVLVALACVERLGQRPELDFKLPAGGSVPVLFSSLTLIHLAVETALVHGLLQGIFKSCTFLCVYTVRHQNSNVKIQDGYIRFLYTAAKRLFFQIQAKSKWVPLNGIIASTAHVQIILSVKMSIKEKGQHINILHIG